jgi:hypothetical protein
VSDFDDALEALDPDSDDESIGDAVPATLPFDENGDELPTAGLPYYVWNVMATGPNGFSVHLKGVVPTYVDALSEIARCVADFEERAYTARDSFRERPSRGDRGGTRGGGGAPANVAFSPGQSPAPDQGIVEHADGTVACGIAGCEGKIRDWYDRQTGKLRMSARQIAELHVRKYGGPRCFIHQPKGRS